MAFTAADVKKLREMTNVGMMDCKKALTESDGDMDKAVEWLREKGLAKAAKKANRIAAEGMAYAEVCSDCGVGNSGSAGSLQLLAFRILFFYHSGHLILYGVPNFRIRQNQTVVTVDWALDSTGPSERFVRSQKNSLDLQQAFCNFLTHFPCPPYISHMQRPGRLPL